MAALPLIVGAPVWDRAWSLPLWFQSVRANVDPSSTGLVFVVPSTDTPTREAIAALSWGFAWVEVLRDRGVQSVRSDRPGTGHATLAAARNQILQVVSRVQPARYASWDTDFLLPRGGLEMLADQRLPLVTSWAWLNRKAPKLLTYRKCEVQWEDPICATAMGWDRTELGRAIHYPADEFLMRSNGTWRCGVALAFQLMDRRAYMVSHYEPHHDGEDIPFNWRLHQRGVDRWCCGDVLGLHLYDRHAAGETALGWPGVMKLAAQKPLAATWTLPRTPEDEAFGFFPITEAQDGADAAAA